MPDNSVIIVDNNLLSQLHGAMLSGKNNIVELGDGLEKS